MTSTEHADRFTELRALLFTIAYEILSSATEADDVLQEAYLRWAQVDLTTVRDPRSYLARVVTRQALNARRAQARRREDYVGPWLPEPLLLDADGGLLPDGTDDVVLAESVSMAMLILLETLTPDERAVFVLREVFGFEHAEIAEVMERSPDAVRQAAHRAREHVAARRPRFTPVDAEATRLAERFLAAAGTGDLNGLMALLAPAAIWTGDGGGLRPASRRPVVGAERVAALVVGVVRAMRELPGATFEPVVCNSAPAVVVRRAGSIDSVVLVQVVDGLITNFYAVRNPHKLATFDVPRTVSR